MGNYRDLQVWQLAQKLALDVYRATSTFPSAERFRLVSQMQRAASSIPINIAEGRGRSTAGDEQRFFRIARGSANELGCELRLARELGYLDAETFDRLLDETDHVGAMLTAWLNSQRGKRR